MYVSVYSRYSVYEVCTRFRFASLIQPISVEVRPCTMYELSEYIPKVQEKRK